ncbi:hypothetical protein EC968_008978 [Mortierella alpina]|nr:hypothetical protein EC968_008978 [Mortierella alpina]
MSSESTLGYLSDDAWTHSSISADSKGFSGIYMNNIYVPPSYTTETGAEDELEKLLFADIPMTLPLLSLRPLLSATTPTHKLIFSGTDMSNIYVPPSNTIETGAEDELEKLLFADIPLTEMSD